MPSRATQQKPKRTTSKRAKSKKTSPAPRPLLEPARNYNRAEAAAVVGVAVITLIRAYDAGHLEAYRVGRRVLHSGQHLQTWLEAGGKTAKGGANQ